MEQGRSGLTPRTQRRSQNIHFDAAKIGIFRLSSKLFPTFFYFDDIIRNKSGLQIADLIAYPLTHHVLNPKAVNLAYDVLAPNIFMEDGKLLGLKIYPSQQA